MDVFGTIQPAIFIFHSSHSQEICVISYTEKAKIIYEQSIRINSEISKAIHCFYVVWHKEKYNFEQGVTTLRNYKVIAINLGKDVSNLCEENH
jgi:hypothetical protein